MTCIRIIKKYGLVKTSKEREANDLVEAMEKFNVKKGLIITQDYEAKETIEGNEIEFVPLWKWLLT